jgi:hypothetical protein
LGGDPEESRAGHKVRDESLRQFLTRLHVLITKGRISPRRASVLAFVTSQLLHSHRSIIAETKFADSQPREIIFDLPRPENPTYADLRT